MGMRLATHLAAAIAAMACACAPPEDEPAVAGSSGEPAGDSDAGSDGQASDDGQPAPPPDACAEPTDVTGRATSIAEAIALINALPRPVTLDCFLQQLERPLRINGTTSTVSLQPAVGYDSPRVFLFDGDLIMSVAIAGHPGNTLLEFGEMVAPTKSIKGEVAFPVTEELDVSAPMERVFDGEGSECRLCHAGEAEAPQYPLAFASDALRFRDDELVALDDLRAEWERCLPSRQPQRCARLDALFSFGEVQHADFPAGLQTIYDYE